MSRRGDLLVALPAFIIYVLLTRQINRTLLPVVGFFDCLNRVICDILQHYFLWQLSFSSHTKYLN